ncbi:hypothetical protein YTPLAS18_02870 [Nitrospira sp.]|nr:hypothetical protein YTPLAS18_02870 [Nitrospira sp.]
MVETRKEEEVLMKSAFNGKEQPKVAICACGTLHFSYGPMTLQFDRSEFISFAESVRRLGVLVSHDRNEIGFALSTSHRNGCH